MSVWSAVWSTLCRETGFLLRDRSVLALMAVTAALTAFAVWSGLQEVARQHETIGRLAAADRADREAALEQQNDWGGAAYYSFHLTYDPPSEFAFAAMGQRDSASWKHRIRMLALEGQIHESDAGNPEFALIGRFDAAFLIAFVLPLLLIVLLYDVRASERAAGRYELLCATAGRTGSLWAWRAGLRAASLYVVVLVPLLVGGWASGAGSGILLAASVVVLVYAAFWAVVCSWLAAWRQASPVILAGLVGIWMIVAVLVPATGRAVIDHLVAVPSGAEIIMTQREAVNDAWDLPKEKTMEAFLLRHPEWADYSGVERPFEWKWYYAFQQVGDQKTESLTDAYRAGKLERDRWAARVALLSPPALVERTFQQLAGTDVAAAMAYEDSVRRFHAELRAYHYPKLFLDVPFDQELLRDLPTY